jgi:hypothetical protein
LLVAFSWLMRRAYPTSFCFQEMIEIILKGFFTASFYAWGFGSYCHDRSGQQTKTGNNETKSPTRKPDVCGTQIHLPTWCPGHPLS